MIIPEVGSSGYFNLADPFAGLTITNERYVCKAIRKLSDYLANNEKPLEDIYKKVGLTEDQYKEDLAVDMPIVSLQSVKGYWIQIPAKYVLSYPIPDGIVYRMLNVAIGLPAMPVTQPMDHFLNELKGFVTASLGVDANVNMIQASRSVMVPMDKHETTRQARNQVIATGGTYKARHDKLLVKYNALADRVRELEQYIIDHHVNP